MSGQAYADHSGWWLLDQFYTHGMRFAVLGDIHGNLPALEAVLREEEATGADAIILPVDSTVGPL
jgi:hypothetical protein